MELYSNTLTSKLCNIYVDTHCRYLGNISDFDKIAQTVQEHYRKHPAETWSSSLTYKGTNTATTTPSLSISTDSTDSKPTFITEKPGNDGNLAKLKILRWNHYEQHFYTRLHEIYARKESSMEDPFGGVVMAVRTEPSKDKLFLVFHREGVTRVFMTYNKIKQSKDIIQQVSMKIFGEDLDFKKVKVEEARDRLLTYEKDEHHREYKFGLLYHKEGQITEAEVYGNRKLMYKRTLTQAEETSSQFDAFLAIMGEKVELKNRQGYLGGLDNKADRTGTHSIFTNYNGVSIMFHVSSMIPSSLNEGFIAQKRHIGNDFCSIIFKEGDEPVNVSMFKTQYTRT